MKIDIYTTKELLVEHGRAVEDVLRSAVQQALVEHKRSGNRVASWADGRIVFIEAANIIADESLAPRANLTTP